jgi:hypothetical protein
MKVESLLKSLYYEWLYNKKFKPICWLDNKIRITKEIKKYEKKSKLPSNKLDDIFEQAKLELLELLGLKL